MIEAVVLCYSRMFICGVTVFKITFLRLYFEAPDGCCCRRSMWELVSLSLELGLITLLLITLNRQVSSPKHTLTPSNGGQ